MRFMAKSLMEMQLMLELNLPINLRILTISIVAEMFVLIKVQSLIFAISID
jgi:hypothetical protein